MVDNAERGALATRLRFGGSAPPTEPRRDRIAGVQVVLALLAAMWVLEVVDVALDHRLDQYGIEPRDPDGLVGVVAAPFLHADFGHLIANTIPFVALGIIIGARRAWPACSP